MDPNEKWNMKQWKQIIEKIGKDRLAILLIGGLLILVISMPVKNDKKADSSQKSTQSLTGLTEKVSEEPATGSTYDAVLSTDQTMQLYDTYAAYLEKKLGNALITINGAGRVKVVVTLEDVGSSIVEKDISYQRDNDNQNDGSTSSSAARYEDQEETVYTVDSQGRDIPYVSKRILPSVEGILIVTDGADKENVKKQMKAAVLSLFDLDEHKIAIVKMKSKTG